MQQQKIKISQAVIWVSSIFLGVLSSVPQLASHAFNWEEAIVNSAITAAFSIIMWYVNIYMLNRNPSKKRQQISYSRLLIVLAFGMVIMFGLAWIQQLILSHINFGPTMLMVEVRGILINLVCYMFLTLLQNNYTGQQVRLELEKVKSDNLGAQYELLKQQINPHFLFNSLNTLKSMAETNDSETVDFIMKLSDFYRFTLESRKLDLITVQEEMKIVDSYLFLQKARFGEGITFTNELNSEVLKTLIPPFTLQLLVENCIKHNIVSQSKPLHIKIYNSENKIIIENPVQKKMVTEDSLGVGLDNVKMRYKHLLEQEIEINSDEKIFQIKLPFIHEYHHH
ncbi:MULTISPECIES: sensor histidine kinase [Chryseobacterium]|uniref:LytS/YehU family sensor histidine kinase n=1 Tax=Chryseobacterium geocarposphaerae TaxID=1416776 RepID=A0ABU1LBS5_9FLAO|nr:MULTISPECIES: sensor histidine kinase [Chryseobacterium]MDR6404164.1 LytS/YehU family sensor histidine kinase [Chryseobacterium geocarposphaerae]MDR6700051.1 LytS/YehU family sensor histidine kinase [Chryseobacterium ginsenosidimutans]